VKKAVTRRPDLSTPDEVAALAAEKVRPGALTLVIANTVDRAREIHDGIVERFSEGKSKAKRLRDDAPEIRLVHSRFRGHERAGWTFLRRDAQPSAAGRIVIATQVVEAGPQACECFSVGRWAIDNLSPCFVDYGAGGVYAVSTFIGADTMAHCPTTIGSTPPPAPEPGSSWSTSRLTVDCAGRFRLCYTLRAGDADAPLATDCMVAETCVDTYYPTPDVAQELPVLPAWSSSDGACARAFRDTGGYGEMSVLGLSIECDEIDDGTGGRYVFNRVNYCPLRCNTMPTLPECVGCMMGGSGGF